MTSPPAPVPAVGVEEGGTNTECRRTQLWAVPDSPLLLTLLGVPTGWAPPFLSSAQRGLRSGLNPSLTPPPRVTNCLQKSGVIWRGSSGRMLTESSARPHSRHSMVYSWSRTRCRKGAQATLSPPSTTKGNLSWGRHLIPDCNQIAGDCISHPPPAPCPPLAARSPFSSALLLNGQ